MRINLLKVMVLVLLGLTFSSYGYAIDFNKNKSSKNANSSDESESAIGLRGVFSANSSDTDSSAEPVSTDLSADNPSSDPLLQQLLGNSIPQGNSNSATGSNATSNLKTLISTPTIRRGGDIDIVSTGTFLGSNEVVVEQHLVTIKNPADTTVNAQPVVVYETFVPDSIVTTATDRFFLIEAMIIPGGVYEDAVIYLTSGFFAAIPFSYKITLDSAANFLKIDQVGPNGSNIHPPYILNYDFKPYTAYQVGISLKNNFGTRFVIIEKNANTMNGRLSSKIILNTMPSSLGLDDINPIFYTRYQLGVGTIRSNAKFFNDLMYAVTP